MTGARYCFRLLFLNITSKDTLGVSDLSRASRISRAVHREVASLLLTEFFSFFIYIVNRSCRSSKNKTIRCGLLKWQYVPDSLKISAMPPYFASLLSFAVTDKRIWLKALFPLVRACYSVATITSSRYSPSYKI